MAYGESKVRRSRAPEVWCTQPAIATIPSTGRGEPRRALRDLGGETDWKRVARSKILGVLRTTWQGEPHEEWQDSSCQ